MGFLSGTFTIYKTAVEGGGYLFNSSLPLPHPSQSLLGESCRELNSAHSEKLDSNWETLVSGTNH